jgi:hypothetical protein
MSYSEIYFAVASVSTIAVAGLLVLMLLYVLSILSDVKRLSKIARREAEAIARNFERGMNFLGSELSQEAAGFIRTIFSLLMSYFGKPASRPKRKVKSI